MKRALLLSLALLASMVTGQESPAPGEVSDSGPLLVLARPKADGLALDLFAPPTPPALPATPQVTSPPPPPSAPPLPYAYLGRMKKADSTIVYLLRNQEMLIARPGDTLEGLYEVRSVTDTTLRLVYLPLGIEQTLSLPAEP